VTPVVLDPRFMRVRPDNVLLLPGWQNSGAAHWQSRWELLHGYTRVDQHDWMQPLRGDWITRLEEFIVAREGPCAVVAHSLGCLLTAAWAQLSPNVNRVVAALLVAPPDPQTEALRGPLFSFRPVVLERLPFSSTVVASTNDAMCDQRRAREYAQAWGSRFVDYGASGHINADSGLADWPHGRALLDGLLSDTEQGAATPRNTGGNAW